MSEHDARDARVAPEAAQKREPGRAIGREGEPERPETSELGRPSDPVPAQPDEPGELPPNQPDEGWQDWPGGHRQGRQADDDLQRRKG